MPNSRWKVPATPQELKPAPGPNYCTVGDILCEIRTWTDEEWADLRPQERPVKAERISGLGWIGAVPAGRS